MSRRSLNVMKWKDLSDTCAKKAGVTFLNGISVVISQHWDTCVKEEHLFHVIVLDRSHIQLTDYLDESDVYSDEPNQDYSCWLTVEQIEYYLNKLSKIVAV